MFLTSRNSPAGLLGNQQEESSTSSAAKIIQKPGTFDILCGKDKTFNKHHGNRIFREMIVSYHDVYAKAVSKHDKMQITKEIVRTLQSKYNARFIKSISSSSKDGAQWQEISNQVARDKVSHALRFASRPSGVAGTAAGVGSGSGPSSCFSAPPRTLTALGSSSSSSSNNNNSSRTRQCRRSHSCTATLTSLQAATTTAAATAAPMLPSTSRHTVNNSGSNSSLPGVVTATPLGTHQTATATSVTNNSMNTLRSAARSGSFNLFYDNMRSRATLAALAALTAFDAAAFQTTLGDDEDLEPNPCNEAVVSDWEKSYNSSESSAFFEEHTYDPDQLQYNYHGTYNDEKDAMHMVHRNQHDVMATDEEDEDEDDEQDGTETTGEEDLTLSSNSAPHYLDFEPTPLPVHSQFFLLPQHPMRQPSGNDAGAIAAGTVLSRSSNDDEAINALMKEPVIF